MTARELERRVRLWQRRLGLEHWELEVNTEEPAAGAFTIASIDRSRCYHHAVMRFGAGWGDWSSSGPAEAAERVPDPDEPHQMPARGLDHYICHELCHLHLHDLQAAAHAPEDEMGKEAARLQWDRLEDHVERTVDELARAFVRAFEG